jgi:biopolymer transport protein ExbB
MELTIVELWSTMGAIARGVVVVLIAMSVVSLAIAADRGWWLQRAKRESARFFADWRERLAEGGYAAAARACGEYSASPPARAVALATRAMLRAADGVASLEAARHAVRRTALETATEARRGLPILATVGSTAPFVGLFGTVVGIVNAFRSMAASGQGGLATVSAGIAEALVTTALGILVAIPAVWIFNALTHEIAALLGTVEAAGEELAEVTLAPLTGPHAEEVRRGDAA